MSASRTVQMPLDGTKRCTRCGEVKSLDGFYANRGKCKECMKVLRRDRRVQYPDLHRQRDRDYYARNKDKVRAYQIEKMYGVSIEQFNQMVVDQGGRCALCGRVPLSPHTSVLHMDHDHVTGAIRLPLCSSCNNGLGRFRDDPNLLRAAAAYIEAFR